MQISRNSSKWAFFMKMTAADTSAHQQNQHNLQPVSAASCRLAIPSNHSTYTVSYSTFSVGCKLDIYLSIYLPILSLPSRFSSNPIKVKLSLCLTNWALRHEGVWGSGCIDPHFLDLGASWRWVVSFTPRPLYPRRKSPRYPLDRRLGGPQSRSGRRGADKILDLTGTRTPTPWSSSP
jgi:hypothetical protein